MQRAFAAPIKRRARRRLGLGAGVALLVAAAGCHLGDLVGDSRQVVTKNAKLAFAVQPGNARLNEPIVPPPELVITDSAGRVDTTFTGMVTLVLGTNPSGAALSGTTARQAENGVVTFPNLYVDQAGSGYRLSASAQGVPAVSSTPFDVVDGSQGEREPTTITLVSGNNQDDTVAAALEEPYVVRVADAEGQPVPGVTVTWAVTTGDGSIEPQQSLTGQDGRTSARHTLGTAVGSQAATAAVEALDGSPVEFTATASHATPARLAFTVEPSDAATGQPITPPIEITARDQFGNRASGWTASVTLSLATNPGGGTLGGTASRNADAGVATFSGMSISEPGQGYRLTAVASGLTSATSAAFDVTDGGGGGGGEPATLTRVSGNDQSGTVGEPLAANYVARVTDVNGDPVAGVTVSWTVTAGGGSVSPGSSTTGANGQASTRHTLGTGTGTHSVRASVSGVSPVTFSSTGTHAAADELEFTVQPSDAEVDEPITPAVEVTAYDQYGNRATGFTGTVTISISANPGGGSLSGTTSRAASSGVATFPGLSIDEPGDGYRLSASAGSLTGATSNAFDITGGGGGGGGVPTTLTSVSGNGQSGTVGEPLAANYVVRVTDVNGDPLAGVSVSWTVTAGGGSVSPGSSTTGANGQASTRHTLGTGTGTHSVRASVTGLSPVTFSSTGTHAAAAELEFTVQPSDAEVDEAITPAVEVTAYDQYGNRATGFAGTVSVAISANPGGGSLNGTTSRAASSGVATFPGLSIDEPGDGYRLSASASGLTGATSAAFDITGGGGGGGEPTTLTRVSGNGQSGTVGEPLGADYVVRVTDAAGAPVAGVTVSWTVTAGGGSVSPGSSTTNADGRASTRHTLGTGTGTHSVRASVSGLSPVTFSATASAGAPAELVFTTQPSDAGIGQTISPPVRVAVRDRFGNTVTGFSGSITMSITPLTGTPGASLSGTRTRSVSNGVATFDDLRINLLGVGYRLRASGAGLTADSAPFTILL